jgi:hypothetical protein
MLRDATELIDDEAEDPAALRLSAQDKQRLQAAFSREFAAQLQQQECPAEQQVRAWLRQQLGIAQLSYDDGYDDEAAPYGDQHAQGAASGSQQQQQQRQQPHSGMAADAGQQQATHSQVLSDQQRGDGVRRSSRSSKGQVSFEYAALFGTSTQKHQAAAAAATGDAGGGKGGGYRGAHQQRRQQQQQQLQQPLTPAAPAPPPRTAKRGGGK